MKHMTASLIAIAVVAVAISIGITVYASVYSYTPEPMVNSLSSRPRIGGYQNTPGEYVLNTTLPSVPDKLMVHRTKPNVTREEVAALAELLGMNGSIKEIYEGFLVDDKPFFLQVSNYSGAIMYVHTTGPERREKDKPENLPSDEEAVEIARRFLEERGLMPEDAFFHKVRHEVVISTKKGEIVSDKIMVGFDRNINDIPLWEGAGITVGVGGYGEVIEMWKLWRESEPYKEYSIITPEEAFEVLKREGVDVGLRNVSTATVNNVYLAYYSKAACDRQTYLKPVYIFEGEAEGKSIVEYQNETAHFWQYIVAAPELGGLYAEE